MNRETAAAVSRLLTAREYGDLLDLCEESRGFRRALWLALNEADDDLRHNAVEAVAKLLERWWRKGRTEQAREYVRRLLWAMNDESGQMIASAPEAVAEIAALVPELFEPYAVMMVSRAFEEPPLVASGLRGVARLGARARQAIEPSEALVLDVFKDRDPRLLGLASWALGEVGFAPALPHLRALQGRQDVVAIDTRDRLPAKSLGQWAAEAIAKITAGSDGAH
jgi:hypothetical protein